MNNIKTFESFSSKNPEPKYKDSEGWLRYLYPEEVAYLMLYSFWNTKNPVISVKCVDGCSLEMQEESQSFDVYLESPMSGEQASVTIDGGFGGSFTPWFSGSYYDPPEGGEPILEYLEVETVHYYDDVNEVDETLYGSKDDYKFQSDIITIDKISDAAYAAVQDLVEAEDNKADYIKNLEFPEKLSEKIEQIRKDHRKELFVLYR